ncbi:MAG: hypothetical protein JO048_11030, partial [Methylobacteriaceae bacterium]|nr:hypothetical protein [Methylobacteriaceae bacterium]
RRQDPGRDGGGAPVPSNTSLATQPAEVVQDTPDDPSEEELERDAQALPINPQPTPVARRRGRAFSVPDQPFLLDPLL